MKFSLAILFLTILSVKGFGQQVERLDYIQIRHTGVEEKPVNSLVLSIEKIDYDFSCDCFISATSEKEHSNKKDARNLLGSKYIFQVISHPLKSQ